MDPDLARLLAYPGSDDLSVPDVSTILGLSEATVKRILAKGGMEHKRHMGRSDAGTRNLRIPRAAVVCYLVRVSKGGKAAILSAIAAQCPQYLAIAQGQVPALAPLPSLDTTPENVLTSRKARKARHVADPYQGHPDLFTSHTA